MVAPTVFRNGNIALITGGASGIGLALAKKCHGYGMKVAIVDISKDSLELAKRSLGERTITFAMDVADIGAWGQLKATVEKDLGRIDLLALNAGIGLKGLWTEPEYFHNIMNVNVFGVVNGISTFLPSIRSSASAANPSAIIITGSKQGITNPPGNPAYNASKAAVKSLAEGLSWELRPTLENPETNVSVYLLVPGWTYTGLTGAEPGSTKGKPEAAWSGEQVVDYLEKKMEEGKFYVICPDNDTSEQTDKKRMLWSVGEMVHGRPPLTRWREEYKDEVAEWMTTAKV
ncbi:MAG: hypothetical protein M1818_000847 [Claussenomyces sp. TS43310]|nr:MAG: hypothetical protein M1818_000847 [Claussenomyces sp. TS43310]